MKLKQLLQGISLTDIRGPKQCEITGISSHSKFIAPGNLFVAKKGKTSDGHRFIPEALSAGAVAVVTDVYDPFLEGVTQIVSPQVDSIEPQLANRFYQFPSKKLFTVGITGTNGKTTTTYLVKHLLDGAEKKCGVIGTIEHIVGNQRYPASHTTPDLFTLHQMLYKMRQQHCLSAVMEVSSHAIDQGRVRGVDFDGAVFTNLSPEHLDYHGTMEAYAQAKRKLFLSLPADKWVAVNGEDPASQIMTEGCAASIMDYGVDGDYTVTAREPRFTSKGTHFTLSYDSQEKETFLPLLGRYNLANSLAAVCVALQAGLSLNAIVDRLATSPNVPGRLQRVENGLGLTIVVDFAHSEEGLRNLFGCLKGCTKGKMIAVFGCGGDRDWHKRPKMAQACEESCGLSIVTSDNPRSEDPLAIIDQVITGFRSSDAYQIEPDRTRAIQMAIASAQPGDLVVIAGKGHEKTQIFAQRTIEFDDVLVAEEVCHKLRGQYE